MYRNPIASRHAGYYLVPTEPELAINREGVVLEESTGKELAVCQARNPYQYPYIQLDRERTKHVHRLVAETFLDNSGIVNPIVNHKDGVKYHNQIKNLEWTDYSGNLTHAYSSGLRKDNHPVLAKDLRTNLISRFYSIGQCARHFATTPTDIFHQLKTHNAGKVYRNFYLLIREGDSWPAAGPELIGQYRNGTAKPVGLFCTSENKLIAFRSNWEVAEFLKVSGAAVSKWLRKARSSPERYFTYREWRLGDLAEIRDQFKGYQLHYKERKTWARKPRKAPKLKVVDVETGLITEFESLQAFANSQGVPKSNIQKAIWRTAGTWKNRFRVEYLP